MGQKATSDILDPESHKMILKKHRRITEGAFKRLEAGQDQHHRRGDPKISSGRYLAEDVVDPETGEVVAEINEEVTEKLLTEMKEKEIEEFEILFIDNINVSSSLRDTLIIDKIELIREEREKLPVAEPGKSIREKESERAMIDIYKRLRPGDPPTIETAMQPLLQSLLQSGEIRSFQSRKDEIEPEGGDERKPAQSARVHREMEEGSPGGWGRLCGGEGTGGPDPGRDGSTLMKPLPLRKWPTKSIGPRKPSAHRDDAFRERRNHHG